MGESPAHRHLWDSVASVEECQRAVELAQRAMRRCCDNDGDHGKLFPPHVPEASHFLGDDGFVHQDLVAAPVEREGAVSMGAGAVALDEAPPPKVRRVPLNIAAPL